MQTKSLLLTVSLALLSTTALAADLPSRRLVAVPPPPMPVFSWTGLEIGGQAGYEFGKSNAVLNALAPGAPAGAVSASTNGFVGGAHIGYLYQTRSIPLFGTFGTGAVLGVEGDIDGTTARANYLLGGLINNYTNQPIQGSFRGKLGVAFDRTLVYGTGGVAFDYARNNYINVATPNVSNQVNTGRVGYTVGGGVEYSFTNLLSVRVEYRYTDFGSFGEFPAPGPGNSVTHRETDNRVQAGFSYKIEPPAPIPVVARY